MLWIDGLLVLVCVKVKKLVLISSLCEQIKKKKEEGDRKGGEKGRERDRKGGNKSINNL